MLLNWWCGASSWLVSSMYVISAAVFPLLILYFPLFQCIERELRIYALVAAGGLFHFLLISQTSMPSSVDDLWSAQVAYLTMMAFQEKLETTMKVLCDLNRQKVMFLRSGHRRKFVQEKQPVIVGSPKVAKRSRKI